MPAPVADEVQAIIRDAMSWVIHRGRKAPNSGGTDDPDKRVASVYPGWPLSAKVPPGHTVSGAQGDGDYVRHLGDEFVWRISPPPPPPASPIVVNRSIELELDPSRRNIIQGTGKGWSMGRRSAIHCSGVASRLSVGREGANRNTLRWQACRRYSQLPNQGVPRWRRNHQRPPDCLGRTCVPEDHMG